MVFVAPSLEQPKRSNLTFSSLKSTKDGTRRNLLTTVLQPEWTWIPSSATTLTRRLSLVQSTRTIGDFLFLIFAGHLRLC